MNGSKRLVGYSAVILTVAGAVFTLGRWTATGEIGVLADQSRIAAVEKWQTDHDDFSEDKVAEIDARFDDIDRQLLTLRESDLARVKEQLDKVECVTVAIAEGEPHTQCLRSRSGLWRAMELLALVMIPTL